MTRCVICKQREFFHKHSTHLFCSPEMITIFDSFVAILLQFEVNGVQFPPDIQAWNQAVLDKFSRFGLNMKAILDGET